MDAEFSEEQEQLRESTRRFLTERAPLAYVREMYDDERGTTDAVWTGLVELGVTGLLAPEEHGGAGMGMVDMAVVLEELGRAVHPGPFTASAVGAVSILTLAGDESGELLPALATGRRTATLAHLEPDRRAEWRVPATAARPVGSTWQIDGTKAHVADAAAADTVLVTATDPDGALGVFAVDRRDPGVTVVASPTVDGSRKEATVTLAGAAARRVGADRATDVVAETVDRLTTAAVVEGVGTATRALELCVEYAKERQQFGVPIGSFQAVQHLCADMLRAVELARAAAYYACWACDAADARERHRAATMALAFAGDELYRVGANTIQIHAGVGFTWEHDAHLFYKRLLTLQHTGGGATDLLEELATIVLG